MLQPSVLILPLFDEHVLLKRCSGTSDNSNLLGADIATFVHVQLKGHKEGKCSPLCSLNQFHCTDQVNFRIVFITPAL